MLKGKIDGIALNLLSRAWSLLLLGHAQEEGSGVTEMPEPDEKCMTNSDSNLALGLPC